MAEDAAGTAGRAATVGLLFGVVHSIVEIALARWLGIRLQWPDLAVQAVFWGLTGACGLGSAGALLGLTRRRYSAEALQQLILSGAILLYGLTLCKIVARRSGAADAVVWAVLPTVAALLVQRLLVRRGSWIATLGMALAATAAFCGLQWLQAEWPNVRAGFHLPLIAAVAGFLAPLGAAGLALASGRAGPRLQALIAVLIVGWSAGGAWTPQRYHWRAPRQHPALPQATSGGNLVLIVLDTLRADHLDLFGYERETMPLLSRRVRRDFGLVATSMANASWTLPSHASMFTGRYPWSHGARRARIDEKWPFFAFPLRPGVPTMASVLTDAGYETVALVANSGPLSAFEMGRGFEYYDVAPGPGGLARELLWVYQVSGRSDLISERLPETWAKSTRAFNRYQPAYRRASEIQAAAEEWLSLPKDRPFFLFLNLMEAHDPHLPVPQDDGRFGPVPTGMDFAGLSLAQVGELVADGSPQAQRELAYFVAQYDSELPAMDRALDAIFERMRSLGLYENSLIIVTSDHGEAMMEHGKLGHGTSLHEEQLRVPLLVKTPAGFDIAQVEPNPHFQHVDLLPTAAEVLGFEIPAGVQGSPWGRGRNFASAELYCAACVSDPGGSPHETKETGTAITLGPRKLISTTVAGVKGYDLESDPGELEPLALPPADLLRKALDVMDQRAFPPADGGVAEPAPGLGNKLRSLGYVQ